MHAILQSASERRSAARKTLRLVTDATPADGEAAQVVVHDLSTDGLLIETDQPLTVGETIAVSLPQGGARDASVVWSSSHFFGCRFAEPLSSAVLSAALLKAAPDEGTRPMFKAEADDLPARLTALRQASGLSGEELATRIGVSRQALWYWETGRRTPRPEQLGKIAAELGISETKLHAGASGTSGRAKVIGQCKRMVAEHYDVDPASVRILVEL